MSNFDPNIHSVVEIASDFGVSPADVREALGLTPVATEVTITEDKVIDVYLALGQLASA